MNHVPPQCRSIPRRNQTPCNDGNLCTQGDACLAGVCTGIRVVCRPLDQCHDAGTCDPATGTCSNPSKLNVSPCDDGNPCTENDRCRDGVCGGTPKNCGDGIPCTVDRCNEVGSCIHETTGCPCDSDRGCQSNNPCTIDTCIDLVCVNMPVPDGRSCSNGNPCDGEETCHGGECTRGVPSVRCALNEALRSPVCAGARIPARVGSLLDRGGDLIDSAPSVSTRREKRRLLRRAIAQLDKADQIVRGMPRRRISRACSTVLHA